MLEKLWEGIQSLGSLKELDMSKCENLIEVPDLSKATNLNSLKLNNCKSLVTVPNTIRNLRKLVTLEMKECTRLEALPTDVNLSSLETFNLNGCSRLKSFPQISRSIEFLYLDDTAIEQVPSCIGYFYWLAVLKMRGCRRLEKISRNIFSLTRLEEVDFSDCGEAATMSMEGHFQTLASKVSTPFWPRTSGYCKFNNCLKLDKDARAFIQRSYFRPTVLPGGEVPTCFTHRSSGNSITFTLPLSYHQKLFEFKACVVVEPLTNRKGIDTFVRVTLPP
ncbi:LRR-like disease resistance protein [Raphanus sativus]|nr:LRR-like disease resistance protein [Raphanus sativus]